VERVTGMVLLTSRLRLVVHDLERVSLIVPSDVRKNPSRPDGNDLRLSRGVPPFRVVDSVLEQYLADPTSRDALAGDQTDDPMEFVDLTVAFLFAVGEPLARDDRKESRLP